MSRRACVASALGVALAVSVGGSAAHGTTPGPKTCFVLGQQLVGVDVAADTPRAAVAKLLAGPPARGGMLTFVPKAARLRRTSRSGSTATVDLNAAFASGWRPWRAARLAQLVYTVTSVRGVRRCSSGSKGRSRLPRPFPSTT